MKRLFVLMITFLMLIGCSKIDKSQSNDNSSNTMDVVTSTEINVNDLVYHDYGTSIKLTNNSSLIIENPDLNLKKDETAIIYLADLKKQNLIKIWDYKQGQFIKYKSTVDGVFRVVAELENGTFIDLTTKANIRDAVEFRRKE